MSRVNVANKLDYITILKCSAVYQNLLAISIHLRKTPGGVTSRGCMNMNVLAIFDCMSSRLWRGQQAQKNFPRITTMRKYLQT